ncbi:phosphoribosyl transferase domain protein [Ophiobolus disseminans]|uniref:Phosphoribosyl transferase domain protein n=1 Tax=Ophiobolus disseminans TaxID=1469910 RepID=A0A6A6ZG52_9PLEO|nr:phosphoribosyl transferase domain protein [Ophiobolus disseminans]
MAALSHLKRALKAASSPHHALTDTQYATAFDALLQTSSHVAYRDFIFPELTRLFDTHFPEKDKIRVLEIGPGPKSVLAHLPLRLREQIGGYVAYEPNGEFAENLARENGKGVELPGLVGAVNIRQQAFTLESDGDDKFDVVLFCHSMYGMKPARGYIERALEMLTDDGMVVVFHRDGVLDFEGLVCHDTTSFPTAVVRVADEDKALDVFAAFIAGGAVDDEASRITWREVCRSLGRRYHNQLEFSAPESMVAFSRHATALPELTAQVPLVEEVRKIKNGGARLQHPAGIVRPENIEQVQQCVQWAVKHKLSLTVVGGSHGGHCLRSNVVAVDMSELDQVYVLKAGEGIGEGGKGEDYGPLVVAEAGCTTGDIIRTTMAAGLTVPLGSRPSVGAGLWLQGGIGHLSRLHGLASDAIVRAVLISVATGEILRIGNVPSQHVPLGSLHPKDNDDLMWALKGAGTNFGIVLSVTLKAIPAPTYVTRNWTVPLDDGINGQLRIREFDDLVAGKLDRNRSADAYLYCEDGELRMGITMFETSAESVEKAKPAAIPEGAIWGPKNEFKATDSVGLFDSEMYMFGMHGGHGGGKTSSFKRCIFLKDIGRTSIATRLLEAIEFRPSPFCYVHLLHGGGAVTDVASDATAFGCRDWDFACVITGVWPRDEGDDSELARSVKQWVYDVAGGLLPLSCGAYGADLGQDKRDAALAVKAFGPNLGRLTQLKKTHDPSSVLAYACPLKATTAPRLIILATGGSGAGKDFCADVWRTLLVKSGHSTSVVSISDATKREYAATTGANLHRLLEDRAYKEEHRPALTVFFQGQVQDRPNLPQEHFLDVVRGAASVEVLIITGMRDGAPVSSFSHLVPDSKMLEFRVCASAQTRQQRLKASSSGGVDRQTRVMVDYQPDFIFDNDTPGHEAAEYFATHHIIPCLHPDLEKLRDMVRSKPDFPRPNIDFRHVLGITQQPGGLALCTHLLQGLLAGGWSAVDAIVCCEVGGLVFASPLALQVGVSMVLIREAGKLPPPTLSVTKSVSHISALASGSSKERRIEIERDAIGRGAQVAVVDDVLATGETLCAVLQLLCESGVEQADVIVLVLAEFPVHRGRAMLRHRGFGQVGVRSLLVFGGA